MSPDQESNNRNVRDMMMMTMRKERKWERDMRDGDGERTTYKIQDTRR